MLSGDIEGKRSQVWWLRPVIPATWEAEIRRTKVQGQIRQKVSEIPYQQSGHGTVHYCDPSYT
jgi:hypothetical protein